MFSDAETMITAVRPDVLVVATEPASHVALTVAALEQGVHVVCEKPLTIDAAGLERTVAASRAHPGLALIPVHQYRYSPAWAALERWGRNAQRLRVPSRLSVEVVRAGPDPLAVRSWRTDTNRSGGLLADHGVHFLALAWQIHQDLAALSGASTRIPGGHEGASATVKFGRGVLDLGLSYDGATRRTSVSMTVPGAALRWQDTVVEQTVMGRRLRDRAVAALSDRLHVDALYLSLYRDVADHLGDPAWRRARTAEALGVAVTLVDLLELAEAS